MFFKSLLILFMSLMEIAEAQQMATVTEGNRVYVRLERVDDRFNPGIPFIEWKSEKFELIPGRNLVKIQGRFNRPVHKFSVDDQHLTIGEFETFTVEVPYLPEDGSFQVVVFDEQKKAYRDRFRMTLSDAPKDKPAENLGPAFPRVRLQLGAGITAISYRQQDTTPFNEMALTIKGGLTYALIPSTLDLGISSFLNAAILSNTSPSLDDIKYFGSNLRLSWHINRADAPVRLSLSGGAYWNSSSGNVGFANMIGPQVYPDLSIALWGDHSLYIYSKLAVSLTGYGNTPIRDNREIAGGIHYSLPVSSTKRLSVGVDLSQLSLRTADAWASTNTYSTSLGLSF